MVTTAAGKVSLHAAGKPIWQWSSGQLKPGKANKGNVLYLQHTAVHWC